MGQIIYHAKEDPTYQKVYVDIEHWEERLNPNDPDGGNVKYFFVHGGFMDEEQDRDIKFSFCFPEKEVYKGHFFQYLCPFPGPDEEMASFKRSGSDDHIAFALINGAYFIETNMGSKAAFGPAADQTLTWKSSAMCAEYSREYAMKFYGCTRPYGYVYGGSGGGYKSMACIENTDAWDGVVKAVHLPDREAGDDEYSNGVDTAWKKSLASGNGAWIEMEEVPLKEDPYLEGLDLTITSGKAEGKVMRLQTIVGNALVIGSAFGFSDIGGVINDIQPGDTVHLDNSDYIAIQL